MTNNDWVRVLGANILVISDRQNDTKINDCNLLRRTNTFRLADILRLAEKHLLVESVPLTEINDTKRKAVLNQACTMQLADS